MEVEARSPRRWVVLATRALSAGCFVAAVAVRHGPGVALASVGLALVLVAIAGRPKAARPLDAVYSASADLLLVGGKRRPGQLSITTEALLWAPSAYSRGRGSDDIVCNVQEAGPVITLETGPGLLDLVVKVDGDGEQREFLTRRSRRVRQAIERLTR